MSCSEPSLVDQELVLAIISSVLLFPLSAWSIYLIFTKASRLNSRAQIIMILSLIAIYGISYPISRFTFYAGLNSCKDSAYIAAALLIGIGTIAYNASLWLFSVRIWIVAQNIKYVLQQQTPFSR